MWTMERIYWSLLRDLIERTKTGDFLWQDKSATRGRLKWNFWKFCRTQHQLAGLFFQILSMMVLCGWKKWFLLETGLGTILH